MPIRGLTDRVDLSFPYIGDIRKGEKKTQPDRPGADLTYFRAVFSEQERDAALAFFNTYGPEPRELNIVLPFPEPDRNFEAWQEEYTAGALQHRCDGVTCVLWRDSKGEMQHDPKPCPGGCKPTGRLKIIVPELRRLAFLIVHTTSVWDIQEITRNLQALRALTRNGVNGIPLVLKRRPREISTPWKDGKRARRTKWLLSIEADPKWVDAKLAEMQRLATPGMEDLPQLTAPDASAEDGEEVTGEYEDNEGSGPDWGNDDEPKAEVKVEPTPKPEPVKAQPAQRPILDAAALRTTLRLKAGWTQDAAGEWHQVPSDEQRPPADDDVQRLGSVLGRAIHDPKDTPDDTKNKRHSVIKYLFGRTSGHALEAAEVKVLLEQWEQAGHRFQENENASAETRCILTAALAEAGQQSLNLEHARAFDASGDPAPATE